MSEINSQILSNASAFRARSSEIKTVEQVTQGAGGTEAISAAQEQGAQDVDAQQTPSPGQQQQLEQAVTQLNDYVQSIQRDLHFSLDEASGESVITVVDRESQKFIRQIPAEGALQLARNLNQEEPMMLFSAQV